MCVCVCVCVRERERERDFSRKNLDKQIHIYKNIVEISIQSGNKIFIVNDEVAIYFSTHINSVSTVVSYLDTLQ